MTSNVATAEGTILYVDDTAAQRYAVAHVLRRAGFQVMEASTGGQALAMADAGPDVIILDINLPDISGIEVCRRIKSNESTARIPVLQISATSVDTGARVAGLESGADGYLTQPIEPQELIATVRALVRARRSEEALWQSELQYRSFFEATPVPCWVFDTSKLKIITANPAAVQLYGYSKEEFTNLTVQDVVASDEEQHNITRISSSSKIPRISKHRSKSGKLLDIESTWAPLQLNGCDARLMIVRDMTERLELEEAERNEEIRQLLLGRALQAQEDERRRIARELHDETGQLMTSLLLGLRSIADSRRLIDAKTQAKRLRLLASRTIDELGRLARGLHSSVLDDLGLEAAIRRYTEEFSETHHIGVEVDFGQVQFTGFSDDEQLNLYRIVQEALTNVSRHSQAKHVNMRFEWHASELKVTI